MQVLRVVPDAGPLAVAVASSDTSAPHHAPVARSSAAREVQAAPADATTLAALLALEPPNADGSSATFRRVPVLPAV